MPRVITLQTSFNSGTLDPRLAARTDLKHFYQGAAEAVNVQSLPQGGMKRRPGMKYVADIGAASRLAAFAFNVEQTYLIVFTNNNIAIYKDDVWQVDVTTTYTTTELFELQWTQSADTMIIVHKDHQPAKLVRGESHAIWALSGITFKEYPTYDFLQNYDEISFSPEDNGNETDYTEWNKIDREVKVTHDAFPLGSEFVGGIFDADSGKVRITSITSDTEFIGDLIRVFKNDDSDTTNPTFDGEKCVLEEKAWSSTRGWPKSITFYQGRMWMGGSSSRPQTLWGSKTNDFFNFDFGDSLDDEGISLTLDTDQVNAITAVYAGRHLQIFTTGGEFSINDIPITPAKSAVRRHTLFGSSSIPPKSIDGATLFVDRTGKSVREFLFAYTEDAYTAGTVSLLASHLLDSPVDMAALRGTGKTDANYVYFVNSDGTVAVFNSLRAQEVGGWTQWTTNGSVEAVAVVVEEVYFLVKRTINGVVKRYLERLDPDTYTDACATISISPASATVTGLGHLDGETCRVRADGSVMANHIPASGSITLARASLEVEVGLNYDATIKTMPVNQDFQDGPTLTRKKRVVRVIANLYESLGVSVNGQYMVDRSFGMELGSNVTPFTGIKKMHLLGWTDLAQVTITQVDPGPMTILGLGVEVEA
jgi:hypothetical protein